MTAFSDALPRVLVHEGGYVNHAADPGGATNFGVTQRVYDAYRARKGKPAQPVKAISKAEVEDIFRAQYWDAIKGDKLPVGVSYVVMDGAVNSGPKQSIKWLQRALDVPADGILGEVTLAAVAASNDHDKLIDAICDRRMAFLRALKTFPTFGRGWTRRVDEVRAAGKAMAAGSSGLTVQPAAFVANGNAKAEIEDAKTAPGKGAADAATGGGLGAGGIGAVLTTAQEQLTPYSVAGGWISKLVVGLIILGAVLTIGGVLYRFYANRKKAALSDALDVQV